MTLRRVAARAATVALALLAWGGAWAAQIDFGFYDDFGNFGRARSELSRPVAMDKSEKDLLAVVDTSRNTIVLFDERGNWIRSLGSPKGQGAVELKEPAGVAFDSLGRLWVADTGNHRVVVMGVNGNLLRSIGEKGFRKGEFNRPVDISFGARKIFVADAGNSRVQVLDTEGAVLDVWREKLPGAESPIRVPSRLTYSTEGAGFLWLVNDGTSRVVKLDMEGRQVDAIDVSASVEGEVRITALKAQGAFDRLFVCESAMNRVLVFGHGKLQFRLNLEPGSKATALAIGWNGDVFVADDAADRILEYRRR